MNMKKISPRGGKSSHRSSARSIRNKTRKEIGPNITCSVEQCKNYGKYKCERRLFCSNKWKACGELLCVDHCEFPKDGKGHCFSDPKTDCQQRYEYAKKRSQKEAGITGFLCSLVMILILYVYFVKGAIQSFSNDIWKITINRNTGYRSFVPLDGNYTNVLIWLHDYNEDTKIA